MKIEAAIFDMDGTLIDSLMFWERFWEDLGERYFNQKNFKPSEEIDKMIRTMILSDALSYVKKALGLEVSHEELFQYEAQYLENFYRCEVRAKVGAVAFLECLKQSGIKLCLASATDMHFLMIALDACGLTPYFDVILSCADIGVGKDRPDIYLLAAERLNASVGNTCVFEDSCVALETAKNAGFLTVGIYDKHNREHERLRAASMLYVGNGETMEKLIPEIQRL